MIELIFADVENHILVILLYIFTLKISIMEFNQKVQHFLIPAQKHKEEDQRKKNQN